jgi:GTP-binding protein Era
MSEEAKKHKAGFVNIIGNPNVGKSTLMNALVGEKLSIITNKAQTTRHRILGIVSGDDFQIVYSDTPGIIQPGYKLQESMMQFLDHVLVDADLFLYVVEGRAELKNPAIKEKFNKSRVPLVILLNKIDISNQEEVLSNMQYWQDQYPAALVIPVSAKEKFNIDKVFDTIVEKLPFSPAYYDKEEMTTKSERFFAGEIIREKILQNYSKEIPYSVEVEIQTFKEQDHLFKIASMIYVSRQSQKGIIIGHEGKMLKKVGTEARKDMEQFFGKKVFLELFVKVKKDWRENENDLKRFGYIKD